MKNSSLAFTALLLFLSGSLATWGKNKKPRVIIEHPPNGWTAKKVINIQGRVENARNINEIKLLVNGISRFLPVQNDRFEQKIVLGSGSNYIKVIAENEEGLVSDYRRLVTNNQQLDLKVILSWDTNETDVDLHVTDPNAEQVYYSHSRSKIGGSLDIDVTDGYGPETFTLSRAVPGEYLVEVKYYGGNKPTMAKVLVIMHEGTEKESRKVFPALLLKGGNKTTIGKFKIQ